MIRTSESIATLAPALLKAQVQCSAPLKDSKNPHFGSSYANLESVRGASFDAFANNGLALIQCPAFANGLAVVVNRLVHESGEWLEWEAACPVAKNDPQSWRGAVTYIRRTCQEGIGNLAAEDDDGNTASQAPKPKAPKGSPAKLLTEAQKDWFYKKAGGDADLVHGIVANVTGKPCARTGWPPMTVEQHGKISEQIDAALDDRRAA